MVRSGDVRRGANWEKLTPVNAWSLVAAWTVLSVPVSLVLGAALYRGRGDRMQAPLPVRVPATTAARPIA